MGIPPLLDLLFTSALQAKQSLSPLLCMHARGKECYRWGERGRGGRGGGGGGASSNPQQRSAAS